MFSSHSTAQHSHDRHRRAGAVPGWAITPRTMAGMDFRALLALWPSTD